jgi:hypothetical protein
MSTLPKGILDQWKQRYGRLRLIVTALYMVLMALSLVPLISLGATGNILGASVVVTQGSEGSIYLSIRNDGPNDWTGTEIDVDGRYVLQLGDVPSGMVKDLRAEDLISREQIPRPAGLFGWERGARNAFPAPRADLRYQPRSVTIQCAEGTVTQPVGL